MSFGWHGLLGSHSSLGRLGICKKRTPDKSRRQRVAQKTGGGKKWTAVGIYRRRNTSRFAAVKDPFTAAKPYYAAAKGSSLR